MIRQPVLAFKCNQIVLENEVISGGIAVDSDGKICKIMRSQEEWKQLPLTIQKIEFNRGVLMPGVVDSHVHVNSPGRSDWEDFPCATQAAAAGGVTTIVDMPLNSIPSTTTLKSLQMKADVARGTVFVDVAFWGGVVPGNQNELLKMIAAGVVGFKCFLCPSGVDEFPNVTEEDLEKALEVLQNTDSVLAFHAECDLEEPCETKECNPEEYKTYLSSRPPEMELKALELIMKMTEKYRARYHIVHMSSALGVPVLEEARKRGVRITAETCPHYLTLDAATVPPRATQYKCAPPVRDAKNRDALWECLKEGSIDMVVSDHSPCTPVLKTSNFLQAWGGISSLQFGLSLVWTRASNLGMDLVQVSRLMSGAPARLCSLNSSKGAIEEGMDADLILFDPYESFEVTKESILYKNKVSPYLGMKLKGKVLATYLRGIMVYDDGRVLHVPGGKLLLNC